MEPIGVASHNSLNSPWMIIPIAIFIGLILYFLFKFFSVMFDFIQAKGCLTIGLLTLVGLPGIVVLSLVFGYTVTATVLIVFSVIGVITGYIALDAEGNVGKFGLFILIVSSISLVLAILVKIFSFLQV
jgi:hypothetical protein